jgi:hypothetical protein
MNATKIYRHPGVVQPDTEQPQEALKRWWANASSLKVNAPSEYEALKVRSALRAGKFTVSASMRRGYIVLTAITLS